MTCGIYKITNTANGKVYIGSSVDVHGRFNCHRSDLRNNRHGNQHLQNAWNLYGENSFVFEIIEESVKSIKKATNPGRTCKGFTFSYIKENA